MSGPGLAKTGTTARAIAVAAAMFWPVLSAANDIVLAARSQIGVTVHYDPSYREISFPNGDVPRDRGVCTDVVVRALRDALGRDLQREVNEDMTGHWDVYPRKWGSLRSRPDPNIDHRRVPNLMTYFTRKGYALPIPDQPQDYAPGDIVAWRLGREVLHIGIVSDRRIDDRPLIVHNIGSGTREEDVLLRFGMIIGHYRIPGVE